MSTRLSFIAGVIALVASSWAHAVTWDGGGDGVDWHDPLNWDTDAVPGPDDDVLLVEDLAGIEGMGEERATLIIAAAREQLGG